MGKWRAYSLVRTMRLWSWWRAAGVNSRHNSLIFVAFIFSPRLRLRWVVLSCFVSVQSCYGWLSWRRRRPARPYRRKGERRGEGEGIGIPDRTLVFLLPKSKTQHRKNQWSYSGEIVEFSCVWMTAKTFQDNSLMLAFLGHTSSQIDQILTGEFMRKCFCSISNYVDLHLKLCVWILSF